MFGEIFSSGQPIATEQNCLRGNQRLGQPEYNYAAWLAAGHVSQHFPVLTNTIISVVGKLVHRLDVRECNWMGVDGRGWEG